MASYSILCAALYLIICIQFIAADVCQTAHPHGHCVSLFGSCTSLEHYTFTACGFLQKCCFNPNPVVVHQPSSSGDCGISGASNDGGDRIVGGHAAKTAEFPWQVSLNVFRQQYCGGTLISDQWVLTAAHCFEKYKLLSDWTVTLGDHDQSRFEGPEQTFTLEKIFIHHLWEGKTNSHDIAMMKLNRKVDTSGRFIKPVCLPNSGEDFDKQYCVVSGWGATHVDGPGVSVLQQVTVPVISNSLCRYYLGTGIFDHNICAGYTNGGKDACQGDSGGPMVCFDKGSWKIAGIVSWGIGCAAANTPGVYTRVTSFLDWIANIEAND